MGTWLVIALVGLVLAAGTFALIPGRVRGGILGTMVVGAIGAVVMTWLAQQVGLAMPGYTTGFFTAVVGTGLVLAVWRTVMKLDHH
jgi:uncharacterized membrane protein YeaQ/YmgE (transglycosylase-associated protein family)